MSVESDVEEEVNTNAFSTLRTLGKFTSFVGWVLTLCGAVGALISFGIGASENSAAFLGVIPALLAVLFGVIAAAQGQFASCLADTYRNTERIIKEV